jgi:hypothetical protein
MAERLLAQATSGAPVFSPGAAIAKALTGGLAGWMAGRAGEQERADMESAVTRAGEFDQQRREGWARQLAEAEGQPNPGEYGPPGPRSPDQRMNMLATLAGQGNPIASAQLPVAQFQANQQMRAADRDEDRQFRERQLALQEAAARRAEAAALRGPIPQGMRFNPQTGQLEPMPGERPTTTGLQGVPGYDEQGQPVLLFPDGRGGLVRAQTPDGVSLSPRTRDINLGTEIVTLDQNNNVLSRRPIDIAGREAAAVVGRAQGAQIAGPQLSPAEVQLRAEAETNLGNMRSARDSLTEALRLSPLAYSGPLAEFRGAAAGATGYDPGTAVATREFGAIMTEQALSQLRAIFGGNPTEGERAILLQMQASASMSKAEREALLRRAIRAVETREASATRRLEDVMGGNFGRVQPGFTAPPRTNAQEPAAAPAPQVIEYDAQGQRVRR